jgi:hypothetical protein
MTFDVDLKMKETTTGVGMDVNIRLEVNQAESGLYIASCPTELFLIASGKTPRSAVLEYLSNLFYSKTVEAEQEV